MNNLADTGERGLCQMLKMVLILEWAFKAVAFPSLTLSFKAISPALFLTLVIGTISGEHRAPLKRRDRRAGRCSR